MSILATESAAPAAAAASSRSSSSSASSSARANQGTSSARARTGGRTSQGKAFRSGGRTSQGTTGGRRASTAAPARQRTVRGSSRVAGRPRRQPSPVRVTRSSPGGSNYQNIILAEFVLAVILVAATPYAKKDKGPGVSPYEASDMLQLVAITLVYFILAMVSGASNGAARLSAWLGGLILLTVGLGEAARLAKLLDVFGLQDKTSTTPVAQPENLNPGENVT